MDAQAIFFSFGDPEGKNGPAWRGLVSKNGSTICVRILKNSSVQRLWCSAVADQRLAEPLRLTHHPSVILKHLVVCFFAIGMHACTSKLFLMISQPFLSAHQAADFQGVQLEDGTILTRTHPMNNHTRACTHN